MNVEFLPNFRINPKGRISEKFLKIGILDFHNAAKFVGHLPYGRNESRTEYELVLSERKGTCSTKHALLSALCIEHEIQDIQLYTGIYEMNDRNTPGIGRVLRKYGLNAVPEAHLLFKA